MALTAGSVVIDASGNPNVASVGTMAREMYDSLRATFDLDGFTALTAAAKQAALQQIADIANASAGGVVEHFYDQVYTIEGGVTTTLINATGGSSVKGTIVALTNGGFKVLTDQYSAVGVVYDNGVPNGFPCRVVTEGFAEVLFVNGVAPVAGYWAFCSTTSGRASNLSSPPFGGTAQHDEHFKELGHVRTSKSAGTDVLGMVFLHPN